MPSSGSSAKSGQRSAGSPALPSATAHNIRETIESIVIAFILAFLFRTFEAEAFVIPTGSMAPTLQGRHKDTVCPICGYRYRANASSEVRDDEPGVVIREDEVVKTMCPMCHYIRWVDPDPPVRSRSIPEVADGMDQRSYSGDRILVSKLAYQLHDPERYDVIVFHFPGEAKINYIKRLIGLPGETIRISGGDIYVKPSDEKEYKISRKPAGKAWHMLQEVHDTDYDPAALYDKGWPLRWRRWPRAGDGALSDWKLDVGHDGPHGNVRQTFTVSGQSPGEQWIRYQHFVANEDDWDRLSRGPLRLDEQQDIRPLLITDNYAYNTSVPRRYIDNNLVPAEYGLHWVGDLMVDAQVDVESDAGAVLLDLVEAGRHFRCRIDTATGQATLSIPGVIESLATGATPVVGQGSHQISLANLDDKLFLWVDGDEIQFDRSTEYSPIDVFGTDGPLRPVSTPQDAGDLAPAGVGSDGASLRVTRLRVLRDIYYIAADKTDGGAAEITDYASEDRPRSVPELWNLLSNPDLWSAYSRRSEASFSLQEDQFFALGDNSPASQDSRLWTSGHPSHPPPYVPRDLLIGKAVFVYWPHSWNRLPGTDIYFPLFPNFSDMRIVR